MLFSQLSFAADETTFFDVPMDNVYHDSVEYLKSISVVEGYSNGEYRPDQKINRAEFLKIVMETKGIIEEGADCYPDVKNDWFAPYVCKATELGFVKGYENGNFDPGKTINFAEASKIVANVLDLTMEKEDESMWFKNYVYALEDQFAIPTSILSFNQELSRGDMAEIIFRLDNRLRDKKSNTFDSISQGKVANYDMDTMQNFRSCSALAANMAQAPNYRYDMMYDPVVLPPSAVSAVPTAGVVKSAAEISDNSVSADEGSADFSTTNVQVAGVDEADIVKTDGEYIYVLKGDTVRVVSAVPASNLEEVSEVSFDDSDFYPTDMYVDNNRLVVIGTSYAPSIYPYAVSEPALKDVSFGGTVSKVLVYDITDQTNIEFLREVEVEGDYTSSRKIDGIVYLVAHKYNYYYEPMPFLDEAYVPKFIDSAEGGSVLPVAGCADVSYVPGPNYDSSFMVIMGIPVDDVKAKVSKEVVLGAGYNIYASLDNLYVAQDRYYWNGYWGNSSGEETVVHKFSLSGTDIKYEGNGVVPGTILNQFSMDEYDGHFRIATTKGDVWNTVNPATNNVYVLDDNMEMVGKLEGLAPGESIYSMRFMGGKGYMVTFKKIDPLFVLDLSNHSDPKVLGKLKIPGFSDYLHPYDENHVIGFGKDTVEPDAVDLENRGLDFAWYQGMKIAMFDVTDVENPIELHKVVIGDRGTYSELLYNHKALLFDKSRDLMAFPVTVYELPESVKNDPNADKSAYGDPVFQGAYVYNVTVENGFDLKGTISHYADGEIANKSGYYWSGTSDIQRILYIGNYLYTVSKDTIVSHKNTDLSDVGSVELGGSDSNNYDYLY